MVKRFCLFIGMLVAVFLYGFVSVHYINQTKDQKPFSVCTIQPNARSEEKQVIDGFRKLIDRQYLLTKECLSQNACDLIIWPETAVPFDFTNDPDVYDQLVKLAKEGEVDFLFGTVLLGNNKQYNSAALINKKGNVSGVYNKRFLVPFSEYVPDNDLLKSLMGYDQIGQNTFSSGKAKGVLSFVSASGVRHKLGITICSEEMLGFLFRSFKNFNISFGAVLLNDGWFKDPAALVLHAHSSVMHAVSFGIPIVRVANTGLTLSVDHKGKILNRDKFSIQTKGYFSHKIYPYTKNTVYGKTGDTFAILCLCFVVICFIMCRKRREF